MADPSIVNPQITDAVTQTNVKVLGEGPAEGADMAIQAAAHATSLAMENASHTQGGMQQINNAAVAALITLITGVQST
ncbi:RebB family R body protein [Phenylobacterium sp.]|uniref:RebB family R body protein n=1 Tax=Phenylobacterium sp. TaxID=1871053 RepID=UPI00356A8818